MHPGFKPLLSAKIDTDSEGITLDQLNKLTYPLIASPKVDGIRVLITPDKGAVTRKLIQVPNIHIFQMISHQYLEYFDGEVIAGDSVNPTFNQSQSAVMSREGNPEFTFWVFDDFTKPANPYQYRRNNVQEACEGLGLHYVKALEHATLHNAQEVLDLEVKYLERGFEGIMLRSPTAPYKFGRSTLKQQHLIKLKRRADAEATIIDTTPLYRNDNSPTRDHLGAQVRSAHQAGMVQQDLLGTLVVRPLPDSGFTEPFEIGSGFDVATRTDLWNRRLDIIGKIVQFKYQQVGVKDKPRFPIFNGFRLD